MYNIEQNFCNVTDKQSWKAFNTGNRTEENQFNNSINMLEHKEQLKFFFVL